MAKDKDRVSTSDSYKTYLETSDNPVSKTIYLDIVNEFFKFIMSLILKSEHIKLPYTTGSILIRGIKVRPRLDAEGQIKGVSPNWPKTMKLWDRDAKAKEEKKVIYDFNEHTNGFRYRITWVKDKVKMENQSLYALIFSRANKRMTNRMIISGQEYAIKT